MTRMLLQEMRASSHIAMLAVVGAALGCRQPAATKSEDSKPEATVAPAVVKTASQQFADAAPTIGTMIPALDLASLDGKAMSLADARARGPVVLVFGCYTSPSFRMKQPWLEALAKRWHGVAEIYVVFSREEHPGGAGSQSRDALDLDHDGVVQAYEETALARLANYTAIAEPRTANERTTLARTFRGEIPGTMPILLDTPDDHASHVLGAMTNSAFVLDAHGALTFKQAWAGIADIDRELSRITGKTMTDPVAAPSLDVALLSPSLATATQEHKTLLLEFVAGNCSTCDAVDRRIFGDTNVKRALDHYALLRVNIDEDASWTMFAALRLHTVPAFASVTSTGEEIAHFETTANVDVAAFVEFLSH